MSSQKAGEAKITYAYHALGGMKSVSGPVAIERTHDARGHLLAETRGVVTTAYGIDAFGQVRDQRGPHALEHWTFDYDDDGQLTSRVLAEAGTTPGATWSYAYDATSVEETGPEATITRTVNARGRVKSESISGSSGDARVTEHTWDGPWVAKTITTQGDSTLTVEAAQDDRGREWSRSERWSGGGEWYAYASTSPWSGRTAAVEDVWTSGNRSASRSGELETDSLGNVVRASFGADDTWTYDAEGVLVAEARAGEAPVEYRYAGSRLEQRIQGDETTVYGHDAYGRITSTMDPANVTHEFRYGPTGLLEFERHGAEFVELTYDGGGFLASRTRNGRVTYRYTHGPRGELQQVAAPFGSYELSNDAGARLTGLTMPGGPMPSLGFGYDHLGRETSRRRGSAAWTTRWSGATATTAGPNGDVATSVVDPRGRTMKSTYAAGATSVSGRAVRFDYDGLDRPLGGDDEHGSTTYAYDSAGRLNAITRSGATVAYGLDGFGRVESVSSPGGVVTYGYDGYGRVSRIGSEGRETTVLWEPGGERLASLSDETLVEQRCYDANGRLTRLVHGGPGTGCASLGPDVVAYGYAYDGDGNVQRETYEARGETQFREYAYEHGERLQRVDDVTGGRTTSWTLANDGSRLLEEEGALGASPTTRLRYGYDPQGGLASITDEAIGAAVATYETDLAGRVQRELRHGEGVTRRYGWSADDRLVSLIATETATGAAGSSAVIAYDYAGRRVAQTGGSGTASWMWDDAGLVEESLPGFGSAVYERVGGTVAAVGGARVLHDRLESIVGFAGGPAFRHDAWRRYLGASPEPALPGVGYAGQRWDADLGLSYAQQRWYQPGVGRFLSEDPIGATEERLREPGRLQTFAYAAANPLRWTDPLGLDVGQPESTSARAQEDMAYQAILNERNRDEGNWLQGCAAGEVDDWRNLDGAALNSSSHSPQWLAGYMRCNARPVSDAVYNSDAAKTTREFWTATPARAQVMSCVLGGGNGVLPVGGVNGLPASMQSTAAMCEFGVGAATAVVTAGELGVSGYRALKNLRPPSGPAPAFAAVRTDGRAAVVADEVSAAERIPTSFEARAHDTGSKPPAATKAGRGSEDASASNSGRAPWGITKEGTTRVVEHPRFGKFYKAKSDGLWWSKDRAGHGSQGRPQWKVFEETADGLKWKADANEFGDFIEDKHKGSVGLHIPWSDVGGR